MKRLFVVVFLLFAVRFAQAQVVKDSLIAGLPTQIKTPFWPRGYQQVGRINVGALPQALTFSPDGTLLSVINPGEVIFYAIDGKKLGSLELKEGTTVPAFSSTASANFSADNSRFYTLKNGSLRVWNAKVSAGAVELLPLWNRENVSSATFSLDSSSILYCEKKQKPFFLSLVSVEDQKETWSRELGRFPAIQLVAPPDGSFGGIVCSVPNRKYNEALSAVFPPPVTVVRWNPNIGEVLSSIGISDYYPFEVKLSENAKTLLYSTSSSVRIIDAETGSLLCDVGSRIYPFGLSGDGHMFSCQSALGRIFTDPNDLVLFTEYDRVNYGVVRATALSEDGTLWCAAVRIPSVRYTTGKSSHAIQIWQHVP